MVTSRDLVAAIRDVVDDKFLQVGFNANEAPQPPYIEFKVYEHHPLRASDKTFIMRTQYLISLCTKYRDLRLELMLMNALYEHGISFTVPPPDTTEYFDNRIYRFLVLTDPITDIHE